MKQLCAELANGQGGEHLPRVGKRLQKFARLLALAVTIQEEMDHAYRRNEPPPVLRSAD